MKTLLCLFLLLVNSVVSFAQTDTLTYVADDGDGKFMLMSNGDFEISIHSNNIDIYPDSNVYESKGIWEMVNNRLRVINSDFDFTNTLDMSLVDSFYDKEISDSTVKIEVLNSLDDVFKKEDCFLNDYAENPFLYNFSVAFLGNFLYCNHEYSNSIEIDTTQEYFSPLLNFSVGVLPNYQNRCVMNSLTLGGLAQSINYLVTENVSLSLKKEPADEFVPNHYVYELSLPDASPFFRLIIKNELIEVSQEELVWRGITFHLTKDKKQK